MYPGFDIEVSRFLESESHGVSSFGSGVDWSGILRFVFVESCEAIARSFVLVSFCACMIYGAVLNILLG